MSSEVEVPEEHPGALNENSERVQFIEEILFVKMVRGSVDVGNGEGEIAGGGEEAQSQRVFAGKIFAFWRKKKSWIPSSKDSSPSTVQFYEFHGREVTRKQRGEFLGGEGVKFRF